MAHELFPNKFRCGGERDTLWVECVLRKWRR
jgi:hypothetical protein